MKFATVAGIIDFVSNRNLSTLSSLFVKMFVFSINVEKEHYTYTSKVLNRRKQKICFPSPKTGEVHAVPKFLRYYFIRYYSFLTYYLENITLSSLSEGSCDPCLKSLEVKVMP